MLKTILITVVAAIALFLIYVTTRPDTFKVARSTQIKAAPDKIFPLINDMRSYNTWNPYVKKDPAVKLTYSGPAAGTGAKFLFDGNKEAGKGSHRSGGRNAFQPDRHAPGDGRAVSHRQPGALHGGSQRRGF